MRIPFSVGVVARVDWFAASGELVCQGGNCAATKLIDVDTVFGGWENAQKEHFADGGALDKMYEIG